MNQHQIQACSQLVQNSIRPHWLDQLMLLMYQHLFNLLLMLSCSSQSHLFIQSTASFLGLFQLLPFSLFSRHHLKICSSLHVNCCWVWRFALTSLSGSRVVVLSLVVVQLLFVFWCYRRQQSYLLSHSTSSNISTCLSLCPSVCLCLSCRLCAE